MKIEHYIYIGVIMVLLTACGASRKSLEKGSEVERQALALSEMSGIGVVHGNARMSEGVSVMETEVHYSLPDSTGQQHVTKTVTRQMDVKREADAEVVAEDSVKVTVTDMMEEGMKVEEREEKEREGSDGLNWLGVVLIIGIMVWMCKE